MPRSYEEIIEEILANAGGGPAATLMQDPSRMQDTMAGGPPMPNQDMMLNSQSYETMKSPNQYDAMMNPGFMLDPTGPFSKYDDNMTTDQQERFRDKRVQDYMKQKPEINPDEVPRDQYGIDDAPPSGEAPPQSSMQQLYRRMPVQTPPPSQMPQYERPPQPSEQQMQQLMDFYTSGGQVEL